MAIKPKDLRTPLQKESLLIEKTEAMIDAQLREDMLLEVQDQFLINLDGNEIPKGGKLYWAIVKTYENAGWDIAVNQEWKGGRYELSFVARDSSTRSVRYTDNMRR
jgi:hypothetical protein